tara:strand:+ start:282 stop:533 length:252 start_codon:yes stop_codon:yes gene_type:complete
MTSNTENLKEVVSSQENQTEDAQTDQSNEKGTSATTNDFPAFGWSAYAERINGRFAMIGFIAILSVELLSHDSFLHWAGFLPN